MSGTKRKVFGAEFKAKVGLEAIHGVQTINQIAQEHGVHPVVYRHVYLMTEGIYMSRADDASDYIVNQVYQRPKCAPSGLLAMPDCGNLIGTKAMLLCKVLSQTCDARLCGL